MANLSRVIFSLFVLIVCGGWTHGSPGATGSANLNVGGLDKIPANFINVLKTAALSFNTPTDVYKIDDDAYLTSSPAGNVSVSFPTSGTMFTNTTYRLRWPATIQFKLTFNTALSSCVAVASTLSGCSGVGSTTITTTGGAGTVTFTTAANQFSFFFSAGGTFAHSAGELALYRLSDETDYLAGEIFTPEFKAVIAALNPRVIRPMGWVQQGSSNFNGETKWSYRVKPSTMTWGGRFPTGALCGAPNAISGTDTYAGPAAPDTPVAYTDGEQYQCIVANTNTSSAITLDVGSRGAKTVILQDGLSTPAVGAFTAGSLSTFTYDAILDKWLVSCGNISTRTGCSTNLQASVPIEAQIQLANRVRSNLWAVLPAWASDDYVNNWGAALRDGLDPALYAYPEYSNEVWNFGFPQTQWGLQRGAAFGWAVGSNQAVYGWYGLRVRQIMGSLLPVVFSGQMGRLRRVMAYQAGGDSTNIGNRFNGAQLVPGNAAYNAYTGSSNYSAFPNRPIDTSDVLAYAPYGGGTNLCTGPDLNCTPNSTNAPFYQALVTAWESGDSATSISLIDDDIRTGRTLIQSVTASGTTFTTPADHGFTANSTDIVFQVTGGTVPSGIAVSTLYQVSSTPTTKTFTIKGYSGGFVAGANIDSGSAGSGSVTVGASRAKNFVALSSTWYQFGESNAALYDSARAGAGMANLRVEQYEGNLEPKGLSSAQCTSLSIVGSSCAASIAAAITAWKNDTKARATQKAYFDQFVGTDSSAPPTFGLMPHSKTPAQLILPQSGSSCTGSDYALLSGCLPTSTPLQLYFGFQAFQANWLLKRDLNPAANDNTPMWLEKAA